MDARVLLQNTLHTDASVRADAEAKLNQASSENFPLYMATLAKELESEDSPTIVRTASGLALKNALSAREQFRRHEYQQRWQSIDNATKNSIKNSVLKALGTSDQKAGQAAAQFVAAIAAFELPTGQWPELMAFLVTSVSSASSTSTLKEHALQAIGYTCESTDPASLAAQSNSILTAVVQGARKDEPSPQVRLAAINALYDSLVFVRENFAREGERNFIMQVVCEATQSEQTEIQVASFACLVRIMNLYYDYMQFYMEKALFGLTVLGMRSGNEQVALQAVEFWSAVYEEEIEIQIETQEALEIGEQPERQSHQFARAALPEVLPVLLGLLCNQDEDADEEDWNVAMASGSCIEMLAQCVEGMVVGPVLTFIEGNIHSENWKQRDAAVMAFGSILDGPDPVTLEPLVQQALPVLITMMGDRVVQVRDTVAWTLGRACNFVLSAISIDMHLPQLVSALLSGLSDNSRVVANCCWAIMNLALGFSPDAGAQSGVMSPYAEAIFTQLLRVTEQPHNEQNSRTSAYEALSTFVAESPQDCVNFVQGLYNIVLERLEASVSQQAQLLSVEERTNHEELQSNLCSLLMSIVRRLGHESAITSDRTMSALVQLMQSSSQQSTVQEDALMAVGAVIGALEQDFAKYVQPFLPYVQAAISKHEEYQICSIAVGLIGDICGALGSQVLPYCDTFMTDLLTALQSPAVNRNIKPSILICIGDIALAIGADFEKYLSVVMEILKQAANLPISPDSGYDVLDYFAQLRESIADAYTGIVQALKDTRPDALAPYVVNVFGFVQSVQNDMNRTETLTRSAIGLVGDLSSAFPRGQIAVALQNEAIDALLREGRSKPTYGSTTKETARWATEQVRQARQ